MEFLGNVSYAEEVIVYASALDEGIVRVHKWRET